MPVPTHSTQPVATPSIDRDRCTDCGACATICPTGTLTMQNGTVAVTDTAAFGCIADAHCMMVCPTDAVTVSGRELRPEHVTEFAGAPASYETLEQLLLRRRSVRKFKDQPVPDEMVERILAAAGQAPMGIPPSPIGVTVFNGRDKVRAFTADMIGAMRQMCKVMTPLLVNVMRPVMKRDDYAAMKNFVLPLFKALIEADDAGRDDLHYGAPLVFLLYGSPYADASDGPIVATYMMLAAHALGLGTCMIGTVAPVLTRVKALKEKYGVPDKFKPCLVLIAGYPQEEFLRGVQRPLAQVKRM